MSKTWSRTLEYHPHAHLLVMARGLAPDAAAWIKPAHARFLLPGYAPSRVFRAKMRDALARAGLLDAVDPRVWSRRWTVHVRAIGSGEHAALYLSRSARVAVPISPAHDRSSGRTPAHVPSTSTGINTNTNTRIWRSVRE